MPSPRFVSIRLLGIFALAIPWVGGCSLQTYPIPVQVQLSVNSQAEKRVDPALSQFQYYALAISGGSSENTLKSVDVGFRSLGCLNLEGQVNFGYTYEQLTTTGVRLSLASGVYRFSVFGFHDSPVSNAQSVASLLVSGDTPRAYLLAQATADVKDGNVRLKSTYTDSTPERVAACPVPPADSQRGVAMGLSGNLVAPCNGRLHFFMNDTPGGFANNDTVNRWHVSFPNHVADRKYVVDVSKDPSLGALSTMNPGPYIAEGSTYPFVADDELAEYGPGFSVTPAGDPRTCPLLGTQACVVDGGTPLVSLVALVECVTPAP